MTMLTSLDRRDLLDTAHRECALAPIDLDRDTAGLVLSLHAGHGPDCLQYLAALRALSTVVD
ncbi:hypothetical protein [Nocardia sp. NPDC046763]|uniref:hypothetical protein n=1 Tax=Nocardia sp. NPDC046763 TaxID=3155256 RepID=UPI0033C4F0B0